MINVWMYQMYLKSTSYGAKKYFFFFPPESGQKRYTGIHRGRFGRIFMNIFLYISLINVLNVQVCIYVSFLAQKISLSFPALLDVLFENGKVHRSTFYTSKRAVD